MRCHVGAAVALFAGVVVAVAAAVAVVVDGAAGVEVHHIPPAGSNPR